MNWIEETFFVSVIRSAVSEISQFARFYVKFVKTLEESTLNWNLVHWPEGTIAEEGVWRDYYTGEKLENYTKPWETSNGDREVGDTYNCVYFYSTSVPVEVSLWGEWQCGGYTRDCFV